VILGKRNPALSFAQNHELTIEVEVGFLGNSTFEPAPRRFVYQREGSRLRK
jgi:hypothetical protein